MPVVVAQSVVSRQALAFLPNASKTTKLEVYVRDFTPAISIRVHGPEVEREDQLSYSSFSPGLPPLGDTTGGFGHFISAIILPLAQSSARLFDISHRHTTSCEDWDGTQGYNSQDSSS